MIFISYRHSRINIIGGETHGSKNEIEKNGCKESSFYRIVVADSRSPRDGRFIEQVGYYDPTKEPAVVKVDEEVAKKWLENGAQPSDTVKKLLKIAGVAE